MPRQKLPEDMKKRQITVSLDPDLYLTATATFNASAWVNQACREKAEREKDKQQKTKGSGK